MDSRRVNKPLLSLNMWFAAEMTTSQYPKCAAKNVRGTVSDKTGQQSHRNKGFDG